MARIITQCLLVALLASLPAAAFVFNVTPGVARAVAPLVCAGDFWIEPSGRGRSHAYRCDGDDVTFVTSGLVWLGLVVVLGGGVGAAVIVSRRRSRAPAP